MSSATSPTSTLPSRAATGLRTSAEDAVPDFDPTTTAGLLAERLQAWKHAVGYLEDYVTAIEKIHGRHAKEYEKALKTISTPLREGHHFDQSLGGVAGFFENMRSNTQAMINTNIETEKSIKGSVLPILERLHKEIKHKAKELQSGAQSGAKEVEKLRNTTQRHIELLGQQTASYDSAGGKLNGHDDPYVIHRGVLHRLSNQVLAENNHKNDLVAVQNNFKSFESHVLEVIQQAMEAFVQLAGGQGEKVRALYGDMLGTIQCVPRDFEWTNFSHRCSDRLANANDPARAVEAIQFPNMEHASTKPLIEGSLERKSRNKLSWGYSSGYYVVTPSKFLHEFKDSDDTRQDPKPELSIYLPDAVIGAPNSEKFNVKGKDKSKTISSKLAGSTELAFKAHTPADAQKWFRIIRTVCGATGPAEPSSPVPNSPVAASPFAATPVATTAPDEKAGNKLAMDSPVAETPAQGHKAQEAGVTGGEAAHPPVSTPAAEKKPEAP
ncbi:Cytoskeletal signaling protein slm1 [Tolypocladium ophioglossoides CBS 100239]|uniref:Cytoskeletal signaling protein slm1 n=1 Tax=Tolypocladium ophioglossoides (strain CBS 100239) TaxID=1163406 RepID=A0A0L0N9B6_TOLOC|nr:Cytoskeletal signaling protein slm1 [Tolypocladium ophioglossoides CBS 100239]